MKCIKRSCIICKGRNTDTLWDKAQRKKDGLMDCTNVIEKDGIMYNGTTVICKKCGFVYINPVLNKNSMDEFYYGKYREIYKTTDKSKSIELHTISALKTISKFSQSFTFDSVLDIGCHTGELLTALKSRGYAAYGLDINPELDCDYHSLSEINMGGEIKKFDLVTMFNTLEHIWEPIKYLKTLRKYIRKCIIIGVPALYGRKNCTVDAWFSNVHLWHFDAVSLKNILSLAGYNIYGRLPAMEPMGIKIHIAAYPDNDVRPIVIKTPYVDRIKNRFITLNEYQQAFKLPIYHT